MANDRTIRDALFANPEMHKLILQLKKVAAECHRPPGRVLDKQSVSNDYGFSGFQGPITLLPPIAVDHTEPTTVTVEELPVSTSRRFPGFLEIGTRALLQPNCLLSMLQAEGGQRKILALFAAGLRSVGNHVTGAFGSFGDFFKALSSKS